MIRIRIGGDHRGLSASSTCSSVVQTSGWRAARLRQGIGREACTVHTHQRSSADVELDHLQTGGESGTSTPRVQPVSPATTTSKAASDNRTLFEKSNASNQRASAMRHAAASVSRRQLPTLKCFTAGQLSHSLDGSIR